MMLAILNQKGHLLEEEGGKYEQVLVRPCIAKLGEVFRCWTTMMKAHETPHLVVRSLGSGQLVQHR